MKFTMGTLIPIQNKIQELRKTIYLLEWDIPNIKDEMLRAYKEQKLKLAKKQLEDLINKRR